MDHEIEVDAEVFLELQARAVPFLDTPNSVLRRVLGLDDNGAAHLAPAKVSDNAPTARPVATVQTVTGRRVASKSKSTANKNNKKQHGKATRAPKGSLLPEAEYELPLLEALVERGGSAPSRDVIKTVGDKLGDRLTEFDRAPLKSGGIRWENRVQFVRLSLIERGHMIKESGRGTWAISDEGRKRLSVEGGNGNA